MPRRLPLLVSVPHGGTDVPPEARGRVALNPLELQYYSDPGSDLLFGRSKEVSAFVSSPISRVIVDLNRAPYHLPPRHRDGVVKLRTSLGYPVWNSGCQPDIGFIHLLLLHHYFPFHARIDALLGEHRIVAALDCHSMVPVGLPGQPDEGEGRPLICLGNSGDRQGYPKKGVLSTCPASWVQQLAGMFGEYFPGPGCVALNHPFPGGFISNAHYWHKGIPWVQLEVNRSLYESDGASPGCGSRVDPDRLDRLKSTIREVIVRWCHEVVEASPPEYDQPR